MTTTQTFLIPFLLMCVCCRTSAAHAEDSKSILEKPKCCCLQPTMPASKVQAEYQLPEVTVRDQSGTELDLCDAFPDDRVVVMQFAFTSCSTICPVASGTLAATQKSLAKDASKVSLVTISIDPEFDSPERLTDYARSLQAAQGWIFLTGEPLAIAEIQKSFSAYVPNKSQHEALTFLRPAQSDQWTRITGLLSAKQLTEEVRGLLKASDE